MSSRFASPSGTNKKAHSSSNLTTREFSPSFPKYELSRQPKEKKAKFPSYFLYQIANPLFKLSASPTKTYRHSLFIKGESSNLPLLSTVKPQKKIKLCFLLFHSNSNQPFLFFLPPEKPTP